MSNTQLHYMGRVSHQFFKNIFRVEKLLIIRTLDRSGWGPLPCCMERLFQMHCCQQTSRKYLVGWTVPRAEPFRPHHTCKPLSLHT